MAAEGSPTFLHFYQEVTKSWPFYALLAYTRDSGGNTECYTFASVGQFLMPYSVQVDIGNLGTPFTSFLPYIPKTFRCQGVMGVFASAADLETYYQNLGNIFICAEPSVFNPTEFQNSAQQSWILNEFDSAATGIGVTIPFSHEKYWNIFKSLMNGTSSDYYYYYVMPENVPSDNHYHENGNTIYPDENIIEIGAAFIGGAGQITISPPDWFKDTFPVTPYFHMVFYSGHSFYIGDGMVINKYLTDLMRDKLGFNSKPQWIYTCSQFDLTGYVNLVLPANKIVAYGKGVEYPKAIDELKIPGAVTKYVTNLNSATLIVKRFAKLASFPGINTLVRLLEGA